MIRIRLLTVTDLHQSPDQYRWLSEAVHKHQPDIVACVGDFLQGEPTAQPLLSASEAAATLAGLPAEHVIFTRGNHEGENWQEFMDAWPYHRRRLVVLYGTAFTVGPLVIIGFPCFTGNERPFVATLPNDGGRGQKVLPVKLSLWLKPLMRCLGPAGRTIWLMHEPPVGLPIAYPGMFNPRWTDAVEQYQPLLTVSGHDHNTPHSRGAWHTRIGKTECLNLGRGALDLFFGIIDFEFSTDQPSLPARVTVQAVPWNQSLTL